MLGRAWLSLAVLLAVVAGCERQPDTTVKGKDEPLVVAACGRGPHDGYVWQRKWTAGVSESVVSARKNGIREVVFLGLEIRGSGEDVDVFAVEPNWRALRDLKGDVGMGVRIHPYSGPFGRRGAMIERIVKEIRGVLARAEKEKVKVEEVQLDFDAAQSKLDGYRMWVEAVKEGLPGVRVEVTALPSWIHEKEFKALAQASDGYVLQVHGLGFADKGEGIICDVEKARRWIAQAEELGVPFRVALPTYGYMVAYDARGRRVGVEAEGGFRRHDGGQGQADVVRRVEVESDPAEMAGLVRTFSAGEKRAFRGFIWYRLPVEGDYRNWRWQTLKEVMEGKAPVPILKVRLVRSEEEGAMDVVLENTGTGDADLAHVQVVVSAGEVTVSAADGVGGFELRTMEGGGVMFAGTVIGQKLKTGGKKTVGWVRVQKENGREPAAYAQITR